MQGLLQSSGHRKQQEVTQADAVRDKCAVCHQHLHCYKLISTETPASPFLILVPAAARYLHPSLTTRIMVLVSYLKLASLLRTGHASLASLKTAALPVSRPLQLPSVTIKALIAVKDCAPASASPSTLALYPAHLKPVPATLQVERVTPLKTAVNIQAPAGTGGQHIGPVEISHVKPPLQACMI